MARSPANAEQIQISGSRPIAATHRERFLAAIARLHGTPRVAEPSPIVTSARSPTRPWGPGEFELRLDGSAFAAGDAADAADSRATIDRRAGSPGDEANETANGVAESTAPQSGFLPPEDVFRPLLADMKEPRFSLAWRSVRFRGAAVPAGDGDKQINAALVSAGKTFGLWELRSAGDDWAVQLGLLGGIFSQFNLDAPSDDLINSDFIVGIPVMLRWRALSGRLRVLHQSSHLGDEFLLKNPAVDRQNISFEKVDGILAAEGDWWRVYAGGGYIVHTVTDLDRGLLQWGLQLRSAALPWPRLKNTTVTPVIGADFDTLEERDWNVTTSVKAGLEWGVPDTRRHVRFLIAYLDGFVPFGQFFNTEKVENWGFEIEVSF